MSARKLQSFLGSTATLAALLKQAERLSELQRLWEQVAPPPFAKTCKVGGLHGQVLVLYANNGAIAAKIRQLAPTLQEKFQKKGFEVTSILVRVQARFLAPEKKPVKALRLGAAGTASLRQLADQLGDSPLRQALENMLKRHAE